MNTSMINSAMQSTGRDDCRQTRLSLPRELLGELDEDSSSGLFRHISQCRSCLEAYIALQAAAELACPMNSPDES